MPGKLTACFLQQTLKRDALLSEPPLQRRVLAHGRTIEQIAIEWHNIHVHKVHVEKLIRQNTYSSSQLLNLI